MGVYLRFFLAAFGLSTLVHSIANAASCANYPYTNGINIENVAGGVKILSTASVAVDFDDVDSISDARREATLTAKTEIRKFFSEMVRTEESITRAIQVTKSMQGESKSVLREETKRTVKSISSSSAGLLQGVVPLGECYTAGREFRVSVGVKPQTISQAAQGAGAMNNAGTANPARPQSAASHRPLQPGGSYSDSTRTRKF